METFIDHQVQLVQEEKRIDVEDTQKMLSSYSPIQLQKRGVALLGLRVTAMRTGLGGKSLIDLELGQSNKQIPAFPAHKITTGDIVGLDEYKKDKPTKKASPWSGVVLRVTDTRITLALSQDTDDGLPPEIQDRCQIVKLANNVTYERMIKGLELLKVNAANGSSRLAQVLLGQQKPATVEDVSDFEFFDTTLNDSQKDAVRFALGAQDIALIHGPPGTGKTYTLVEIIRQLSVKQNKKVLVCGPSNVSVDNLVERLARHRMDLVRVGHPARILPTVLEHSLDIITRTCDSGKIVADVRKEMDDTLGKIGKSKSRAERRLLYGQIKELRKDYRIRERKVVDEVISNAQVVLSTLNGCGSRTMMKREFDIVIIDEATQALEAECWIALQKGTRAILAGDHLQLPPTIKTPSKPAKKSGSNKNGLSTTTDLSTTLFDRLLALHGNKIKKMLVVQYRMHEKIMAFSSKELYDNQLVADKSVASHLLQDLPDVTSSENTEMPVVLLDTSDTGLGHEVVDNQDDNSNSKSSLDDQSKANELEVALAVHHIQDLLEDGLTQDQIGVITPYAAQVARLVRDIRDQWPHIEIGTVDGFQGREKEAILLSLVRSNDDGEVGFLQEKRRLNVAMTRAKRHLCVICDSETLAGNKGGGNGGSSRVDGGFLKRWMNWLCEESDLRFSEMIL